jgi:subtilisin family serine protease
MYPGSFPGVVNVTGVDTNYQFWPHSQSGPRSAIAAPATDIYSANDKGQYVQTEGTSYSAAYVSATAALIRSHYPQLTAPQVIRQLINTATPRGHHDQYGYGIVNPLKALTQTPDTTRADNPLMHVASSGGGHHRTVVIAIVAAAVLLVVTAIGVISRRRRRRSSAPPPPSGQPTRAASKRAATKTKTKTNKPKTKARR